MADSEGELWEEHHQQRLAGTDWKPLDGTDWRGTAWLEQRALKPDQTLERLVGLDPSEWTIIAFQLSQLTSGPGEDSVRVVAVPVSTVSEDPNDLLAKIVSPDGEILATDFCVVGADPIKFLCHLIRADEVSMRRRFIGDRPIRLVSLADVTPDGQILTAGAPPEDA